MHPLLIQFFKNIIEQQNGRKAFMCTQYFVFRQLHGKEQTFSLSLRSDIFKLLGTAS